MLNQQTEEIQALADGRRIVFSLDPAGHFKFMNQAGERLTGYSSAELRRLNVLELLPSASAEDLRAQARRSIRQRFGAVFEIEITTKNRHQLRLETSIDVNRLADGGIEFRGIALLQSDRIGSMGDRPRCLHEDFAWQG